MKALAMLKELKESRDFDGNIEHKIDEAIQELEDFIAKYQEVNQRLDSTFITLAVLQNENKSLLKALTIK